MGLLILSRQRDDSVRIGHDITVRIVDIRGDKVRIGFDVPRDIEVHREEIYQIIQREKQAADNYHKHLMDDDGASGD